MPVVLGIAVLVLPFLGVWMVVATIRSGLAHQHLARRMHDEGLELDVDDLPRRPSAASSGTPPTSCSLRSNRSGKPIPTTGATPTGWRGRTTTRATVAGHARPCGAPSRSRSTSGRADPWLTGPRARHCWSCTNVLPGDRELLGQCWPAPTTPRSPCYGPSVPRCTRRPSTSSPPTATCSGLPRTSATCGGAQALLRHRLLPVPRRGRRTSVRAVGARQTTTPRARSNRSRRSHGPGVGAGGRDRRDHRSDRRGRARELLRTRCHRRGHRGRRPLRSVHRDGVRIRPVRRTRLERRGIVYVEDVRQRGAGRAGSGNVLRFKRSASTK